MKKREKVLRCKCPCNRELPSRYKGRQKIFYDSPVCRKIWHSFTDEEQQSYLRNLNFCDFSMLIGVVTLLGFAGLAILKLK